MKNATWCSLLAAGLSTAAFAQSPATPNPVPQAGAAREAASATVQPDVKPGAVGGESKDQPVPRSGRSTGFGREPPMNIRLRDGGVKMPKCAEESRKGLACK